MRRDHEGLAAMIDEELLQMFDAHMPIGYEFLYLDRTCKVTSHCYHVHRLPLSPQTIICLRVDYVDNEGVIRSTEFSPLVSKTILLNQRKVDHAEEESEH